MAASCFPIKLTGQGWIAGNSLQLLRQEVLSSCIWEIIGPDERVEHIVAGAVDLRAEKVDNARGITTPERFAGRHLLLDDNGRFSITEGIVELIPIADPLRYSEPGLDLSQAGHATRQ